MNDSDHMKNITENLLKITNLFSDHEVTMEECHKNFMETEYHGPYAITSHTGRLVAYSCMGGWDYNLCNPCDKKTCVRLRKALDEDKKYNPYYAIMEILEGYKDKGNMQRKQYNLLNLFTII